MINCIENGNNITANSTKEIVEELNNHVTSVANNIEKKLIKPSCNFSKFLKNPNKDSVFITPTNKGEVASII